MNYNDILGLTQTHFHTLCKHNKQFLLLKRPLERELLRDMLCYSIARRTYAPNMTSVRPSVTSVDCDHIVQQKWDWAHGRICVLVTCTRKPTGNVISDHRDQRGITNVKFCTSNHPSASGSIGVLKLWRQHWQWYCQAAIEE